jgi:glycine amidinotransferase
MRDDRGNPAGGAGRKTGAITDVASSAHGGCEPLQLPSNIGIHLLRNFLGANYRGHAVKLRPDVLHLDCAMALLRPSLGLWCQGRIAGELPESLLGFHWIEVSEEEAGGLGTNGLILNSETVIVERRQSRLIRELRKAGMEVIPLSYDAPATVGGAFRCSHHPLIRES